MSNFSFSHSVFKGLKVQTRNNQGLFGKGLNATYSHFCGIGRRQCHYEFNMVFRKSCNVFCAKPKEVDPIKLGFSVTNKCFDTNQYIINNGVLK